MPTKDIVLAFIEASKTKCGAVIPIRYPCSATQMSLDEISLKNRLLNKVSFRHVQAVVLIADLGSTYKAAESANISQPAIVKYLASVEGLVSEPLFERHARGMRPTAACKAILPAFRAIIQTLHHGAQALHSVQVGAKGSVHLGALPAACRGSIMTGLAQFCATHPEFQIHLAESNMAQLVEQLAFGAYDAVIVRPPSSIAPGFQFDVLQEDYSVVLARNGHRLTSRRSLSLNELATAQWVVLPSGTTSRIIFDSWFSNSAVRPSIVNVSTESLPALTEFVSQSDALMVVPRSFAGPALASGSICALDVARQDAVMPLGILWSPGSTTIATETFCEWMALRKWDASN